MQAWRLKRQGFSQIAAWSMAHGGERGGLGARRLLHRRRTRLVRCRRMERHYVGCRLRGHRTTPSLGSGRTVPQGRGAECDDRHISSRRRPARPHRAPAPRPSGWLPPRCVSSSPGRRGRARHLGDQAVRRHLLHLSAARLRPGRARRGDPVAPGALRHRPRRAGRRGRRHPCRQLRHGLSRLPARNGADGAGRRGGT